MRNGGRRSRDRNRFFLVWLNNVSNIQNMGNMRKFCDVPHAPPFADRKLTLSLVVVRDPVLLVVVEAGYLRQQARRVELGSPSQQAFLPQRRLVDWILRR